MTETNLRYVTKLHKTNLYALGIFFVNNNPQELSTQSKKWHDDVTGIEIVPTASVRMRLHPSVESSMGGRGCPQINGIRTAQCHPLRAYASRAVPP